jgi:putative flavoprotein involved in K+ transport
MTEMEPARVNTIVIGGGQSGLSVGYHLKQRGVPFLILDAAARVGDAWRHRWDSLRLFTPARYDSLHGMPFPANHSHTFPTKDEMADYLEAHATRFDLPIRNGMRVDRLTRNTNGYLVTAGDRTFEADNVVVAMSNFQRPKVPSFSTELDPAVVQMHSSEYRNPAQLRPGDVLIVGAGNSGSEIAMELAPRHRVWMAGRDTGHIPFRLEKWTGRILIPVVIKFIFHRILTVRTPLGRKARPKVLAKGDTLIRVKPSDLVKAGVERVPRMAGVRDGRPQLTDDRVLDVANVIWCTGYHPGFSWIELPVMGEHEPRHERGVVPDYPGLYFVGLEFLYSMSSAMIHAVGRDAARVAAHIAARKSVGERREASVTHGR